MVVFTMIAVITAVLVATVGVLALLLSNTRRSYWHIPHPPLDNFWLGHASTFDSKLNAGIALDEVAMEYSKKYGEVVVLFLLHMPYVMVNLDDSNAMRQLAKNTTLVKPDSFTSLQSLHGHRFYGKFIEGETDLNVWLKRQKAFAPFYSKKNTRELVVVFNKLIDKYIEHIDKESEKGEMVSMKAMTRLISSAIGGSVTLGIDIETVVEMKPLDDIFIRALELYIEMLANPLTQYLPIYRSKWQQAKETCAFLRGEFAKYVVKRKKETSETNSNGWKDFLSLAVTATYANREYDVEEVVDLMAEAFSLSHFSTAVTISHCLREILRHPEIEKRLVEEVDQVLKDKPYVSFTDIQSLHYLACVLKETLRRHSTLPSLLRKNTSDLTIAGYAIPVGTNVHISLFCMHLNDKFWPDPMKFDPDRFYSLTGDHEPSSILTFGSGMRACLGRSFAEQKMKMIIARLFQTFTFQLEEQRKEYDKYQSMTILLPLRDPVNCKIKRRLVKETDSY